MEIMKQVTNLLTVKCGREMEMASKFESSEGEFDEVNPIIKKKNNDDAVSIWTHLPFIKYTTIDEIPMTDMHSKWREVYSSYQSYIQIIFKIDLRFSTLAFRLVMVDFS